MSADVRIVGALLLPLLIVLGLTPVAIRAAERLGFYDHPVGYKGHLRATPYLGGAAVLAGFLVGTLAFTGDLARLAPIPICALFLWVVGTLDDRITVSPSLRVAAAAAVGGVLFAAGLGWHVFPSGAANLVLTIAWLLGVINAFNLMDNMDGAAGTVAALSSVGTAILALTVHDIAVAALAVALCGACLGFLPYNLSSPARIFLGDGGSMPIGFVVAAAIMAVPLHGSVGWHRLLVAILLVGVPVVDTALVMVSRWRAGVAIVRGGRDHITHRLRARLPSARAVALTVGLAHGAACGAALAIAHLGDGPTVLAWALLLGGIAALVAVFETPAWAPTRLAAAGGPPASVASGAAAPPRRPSSAPMTHEMPVAAPPDPARERAIRPIEAILLVVLALGCGLSPLLYGFYNVSTWGPITLALLAVLLGLVVSRPVVPRPAAVVALGSLVALWAWSLLSTGWGEATDRGMTDASRWMLYAALFAIYLLLLRNERLTRLLLGCAAALIVGFAAYLLVVMLAGDGPRLFLGSRLNGPLGYVNGEAGYLLLGVWPLVAVAERARTGLAAAAVAGATALVALVLLSETRAVVPALVIAAIVLMLAVPGRRRRAWILVVIAAAVAAVSGPLTAVFRHTAAGRSPDAGTIRTAALAALAAAVVAGAAWGLARTFRDWLGERPGGGRAAAAASTVGLLAVILVGGFAVTRAVPHPLQRISNEARAFTQLRPAGTGSARLFSGGGNRFDYWRIAWKEFRDHPVKGVGAGSYDVGYFLQRRTTEDITQPHSIELQALSELGLVGGIAVLGLIGGVLAGFLRRVARARRSSTDAGIAVAAGGIFLTWLVHTSVDWLHLIPGITGVALGAGAALVAPGRPARAGRRYPARLMAVALCAGLVAVGALFVARITLADHYQSQARAEVARNPARALDRAGQALALQESSSTRYVQAAAFARQGDYPNARGSLLEVTRSEPHNFVPWALLGDLAVRRRDLAEARRDYTRAHRLDPRNPELARLARDPSTATGSAVTP